jgi:hypothetical protein
VIKLVKLIAYFNAVCIFICVLPLLLTGAIYEILSQLWSGPASDNLCAGPRPGRAQSAPGGR